MESSESHLDLESQDHVLAKADSTSPSHRWRFVFVLFSVRQAFISSTTGEKRSLVTNLVSLSSTPSFRLNRSTSKSNTGEDDGDVQLTIRSSSTPVIVKESVQPHGVDHESKKELQKANIAKIVKERDLESLREFGGARGFAEALDTDLEYGLPEDEFCCRHASSQPHESEIQAPTQGFFHILLNACNKYMICLLILCAILSMVFGIQEEGVETGWYEGVFMVNAIIVLVVVSVIREYWYIWDPSGRKELSRIGEKKARVFRGGRERQISTTNVVLGDIIILKVGDRIPADGLFISGESLELDEDLYSTIDDQNPFMYYGSTVKTGNGRMLATSVGKDTVWGEMMSNVTNVPRKLETSLRFQLDRLNTCMQIIGLAIAAIILVIHFIRFKFDKASDRVGLPDPKEKPAAIKDFLDAILRVVMKPGGKARMLVISLTVFLVRITEGLPLMVTLAITYWNKKALSGKGSTQDFLACVTTGSVTTICIDKNCGLTLNQMEVDIFHDGDKSIKGNSVVAQAVLEPLCHGISIDSQRSQLTSRSLTIEEDPLLCWASRRFKLEMDNLKQECEIVREKKLDFDEAPGCGVLLKKGPHGESMESHWKGPAPKILEMCSRYYNSSGIINAIDEQKRMALKQYLKDMQDRRLKTVAFGYKPNVPGLEEKDLILLGVVGLKHKREIEACIGAGINIKLVSGCSVLELESVANHCGLNTLTSDAVVVGENFRNSTDEERMEMLDRICVMGNSLPSDELLLVNCLKKKGHTVAMVGCRTDETPAIKEADVSIAVGKCSTEARESSDIKLSDGDFNFLVTNIILCGRCAYENIQKFLQLELTMTISWLLTSITATACFKDAPMTAIQFLWICLVVPVLGGLAMLTEPTTEQLMKKSPVRQVDSPITRAMWRNIVPQALYQATVLVMLQFKGQVVLGISQKVSKTMVFNSFVLCQVFNWFSARELEKKNVFKGIHRNCWFWMAVVAAFVLQVVYTEIAHFVFGSPNLTSQQWAFCFLIGMVSWVIDLATKFISDSYTGSVGMTTSASSESLPNLERPLINDSSQ